MARKTKDAAEATRNQILDAAERVFSERGVSRTSLTDIAEAAHVTRGAIYWHFKDKAELFCEMVARVTMPMEGAPCQITPAQDPDPLASVRKMLAGILERTAGDAQARRVFQIVFNKCEYVDEMQPVWQRFREMQAGCLDRLQQGLAAAVARGQLPRDLDVRGIAIGLHAMVNGLISKLVMDPEAVPASREPGRMIDVFLDGLKGMQDSRPEASRRVSARRSARRAA
jgi:TetR/AcrR family acrAB operon transcriptional repressor